MISVSLSLCFCRAQRDIYQKRKLTCLYNTNRFKWSKRSHVLLVNYSIFLAVTTHSHNYTQARHVRKRQICSNSRTKINCNAMSIGEYLLQSNNINFLLIGMMAFFSLTRARARAIAVNIQTTSGRLKGGKRVKAASRWLLRSIVSIDKRLLDFFFVLLFVVCDVVDNETLSRAWNSDFQQIRIKLKLTLNYHPFLKKILLDDSPVLFFLIQFHKMKNISEWIDNIIVNTHSIYTFLFYVT